MSILDVLRRLRTIGKKTESVCLEFRYGQIVLCDVGHKSFVACICDIDDTRSFATVFLGGAGEPEASRVPIGWLKRIHAQQLSNSLIPAALGLTAARSETEERPVNYLNAFSAPHAANPTGDLSIGASQYMRARAEIRARKPSFYESTGYGRLEAYIAFIKKRLEYDLEIPEWNPEG